MRIRQIGVFSLLLIWGGSATAAKSPSSSEEAVLTPGWVLESDFLAVYNPEAVALVGTLQYQIPLTQKHNMVWSQVALGYQLEATPVNSCLGVNFEWMPAAFLRLRASYCLLFFHGFWGSLAEFNTLDETVNDDDVMDSDKARAALGHRLGLSPLLIVYFRGVLFLNETNVKWYLMDNRKPYWFNWETFAMSESRDVTLLNQTLLMFNFFHARKVQTFFLGALYELTSQPSTDFRRQLTAGVIRLEPFKTVGRIGKIHFTVIGGIYLEDFYREHEWMVLLGVGTAIDFRE
ncbi:MAG: hypothetical protein JXR76_28220 [Deltaproteobacteria bacterium]|nr:hypothetical protein [Deltaproteobacteria bacterium]